MNLRALVLIAALGATAGAAAAQTGNGGAAPAKQVRAVRLGAGSIKLDGRLDDAAWAQAAWINDFVQKTPKEGAPPTDSMRIASGSERRRATGYTISNTHGNRRRTIPTKPAAWGTPTGAPALWGPVTR